MSKAAQGFSLRRTDRTPQTASSKAAGAIPRRTPLIVKRAIYGWKLAKSLYGAGKVCRRYLLLAGLLSGCDLGNVLLSCRKCISFLPHPCEGT